LLVESHEDFTNQRSQISWLTPLDFGAQIHISGKNISKNILGEATQDPMKCHAIHRNPLLVNNG